MSSAKLIIGIGLVVLAVSFIMLDRQWGQALLNPIGPVDHTLAAIIGLAGFTAVIFGARSLRCQRDSLDDSRED